MFSGKCIEFVNITLLVTLIKKIVMSIYVRLQNFSYESF